MPPSLAARVCSASARVTFSRPIGLLARAKNRPNQRPTKKNRFSGSLNLPPRLQGHEGAPATTLERSRALAQRYLLDASACRRAMSFLNANGFLTSIHG